MKGTKDEAFTLEQTAKIAERHEPNGADTGGVGNLLRVISENAPGEIAAKIAERDGYVAKVRALNNEIAALQTHAQVGGEPATPEGTT